MNGSCSPSAARIFGTNEEDVLRDRAEMLREKIVKLRAKKSSPKQSDRQPPGSVGGSSEVIDTTSRMNSVSTTSVNSSGTTGSRSSSSHAISSSLGSERGHRSRRTRKSRRSRASRALRTFQAHFGKRLERKAVFKKDFESVVFEAYLIYPFQNSLPGESSSLPPVKLPFGHRRLTREVKGALRKCNPWDVLVLLSPHHRVQVDKVVHQVQLASTGNTNVCLVAIDVDGFSESGISHFEAGGLVWTRMVLFFRHEHVHQARKGMTEVELDVIGGHSRLTATVRNSFLGSRRNIDKRLKLQEKLKRDQDEATKAEEERSQQELQDKVEAEISRRGAETRERQEEELVAQMKQMEHDKRVADEARSQLLSMQRQEEDDKRRQQAEREQLEEKIRNDIKLKEMIIRQEQEREDRDARENIEHEVNRRRREEEWKDKGEEDKNKAARESIEKGRAEIEEAKKYLEAERTRMEEERNAVQSIHRALKDAKASLEDIKNGIGGEELKMSEEEGAKVSFKGERAQMRASEEEEAAEKAKKLVKFRDAVGRKYQFPFHLVQTWVVSSNLLRHTQSDARSVCS